jgi:hypothetical protein
VGEEGRGLRPPPPQKKLFEDRKPKTRSNLVTLPRYLKLPHEPAVDEILQEKGQAAVKHEAFLPENPPPVPHVKDEQIGPAGLKGL